MYNNVQPPVMSPLQQSTYPSRSFSHYELQNIPNSQVNN